MPMSPQGNVHTGSIVIGLPASDLGGKKTTSSVCTLLWLANRSDEPLSPTSLTSRCLATGKETKLGGFLI